MRPHAYRPRRSLRHRTAPAALFFAVLIAAAPPASGEDSSAQDVSATGEETPRYQLDPVVVTAEGIPVRLGRVPSDLTVVSEERLERERPFFLADALRTVPGINSQRSGNLGKLTDLRLRGAEPRHTLVLFDGIPLNGPWLGSFDFADLMGAGSVEIFGGPASSLYGSGAAGGVVQILSPAAAPDPIAGSAADRGRAGLFAEYGEQATLRQGGWWRGSIGGGEAGASATRLTSDGVGSRDGYEGLNGQLRLSAPLGPGRLRLSGLGTRGEKELPYDFFFDPSDPTLSPFGSSKQTYDPNNQETDRVLAGKAAYEWRPSDRSALEGEVSGFGGRIENENPANGGSATDFQHTHLENRRGIGTLRARLAPLGQVRATLGAEYREERVVRNDDSNYGGFPSVSRVDERVRSRSLYAEAHAEPGERILADAGIRLEDHSEYGAHGVPRVALGYRIPEAGLKLRAGYGRAFTAPTLTDLFYPVYSSRDLDPERSTTLEAGVDGSWGGGRYGAKATIYRIDFQNLIEYDPFGIPENAGRARIDGQELSARWAPGERLSLGAYAAHLRGTNEGTGERLAKRPEWRTGVLLTAIPAAGLSATAEWRWVDSLRDPFVFIDVEGRVLSGDTPGYAVLNLGAAYSMRRWAPLDLRLRLDNALDRSYSEVKGFPARGRALTAALGVAL